ncbi:hypothetical protein P3T35_004145 [Kitasatospora sp. GP30]|uniref:glycoside hydrolase family 26 protein n=1 Tax=Kitasatospora sp. GP30 TaxID=3035084 RepID=UPI000CAD194C|nr:glycosyl hydrolase [Kitasatospora sp. GP30]MDH6142124.1 hypothetical protein [Kitasatospora sp. GP30]
MRIGRVALAGSALLLLTTAGISSSTDPLSTAERGLASGARDSGAEPTSRPGVSKPNTRRLDHKVPFGAFVGSWDNYIPQIARMSAWLHGADMQVGHTYLAGNNWNDVEGDNRVLALWAQWRLADRSRTLVLNVPMLTPNEGNVPDDQVAYLLGEGARGAFDQHYLRLARKLVALGGGDTVVVLGWEMNGITYTGRCRPDPAAWKTYWRRIVDVMRSVPGQRFRFDFTPSRGLDDIAWTKCYPGDDVVDIIGTDSYDQPSGATFDDMVNEPYGLEEQVEFAAKRGKPVSYPEWGLFRNGDDPDYVRRMVDWMRTHDTAYQTVTDYCPHGFWECHDNPQASAVYRALMSGDQEAAAEPDDDTAARPPRPHPSIDAETPTRPHPHPHPHPDSDDAPAATRVPSSAPKPARPSATPTAPLMPDLSMLPSLLPSIPSGLTDLSGLVPDLSKLPRVSVHPGNG